MVLDLFVHFNFCTIIDDIVRIRGTIRKMGPSLRLYIFLIDSPDLEFQSFDSCFSYLGK